MRKEVLVSLSVIGLLYSSTALAQTCTTAPSCDTLGFTDKAADCAGGKMLKCPFDQSKVFCAEIGSENNGGEEGVDPKDATPGMIYYSDGTISADVISGKTPVGVIAYNQDGRRFVIALDETSLVWSTGAEDVSCIENLSSSTAMSDLRGKSNTECLVNYKGSYSYPAANYCNSYKAASTGKGFSGWYLPAAGELYVMKDSVGEINSGLLKLSKTSLTSSGYSSHYWSSTESGKNGAWVISPTNEGIGGPSDGKGRNRPARCVLAF